MKLLVGELIAQLSTFPEDARLVFGAADSLEFHRLKHRGHDPNTGEEIVQVEFNQLVYRDSSGALVVEEVRE